MSGARAFDEARRPLLALAAISVVALVVREYAAGVVGLGDSEALYASYALHPQPAYLDHPGLVGVILRAIGGGVAPAPALLHRVTAVACTLVPWLGTLAARGTGASWRASVVAGLAIGAVPEIAVGLFAMTPDLPLAYAWLGALGLASLGLRARPSSGVAAAALLFAGVLAGVACAAKASGVLLAGALVVGYLGRAARPHARTIWPWVGLLLAALIVAPVAVYEARAGFPMVHHRLVDTQSGAGASLMNAAKLIGGQLAYVSPVLLALAIVAARDLARVRRGDPDGAGVGWSSDDAAAPAVTHLLFAAFVVPFVVLCALSLWSPVAEPHWLAPAFLALPLHAARRLGALSRRFVVGGLATGYALVAVAHAWVLVPASVRLVPEADLRFDIANELFGWPTAMTTLREAIVGATTPWSAVDQERPVVVGPHWTICAQLEAALEGDAAVGCDGPGTDDFDAWLPPRAWHNAESVLFVTDGRFPSDLERRFPRRFPARVWHVPITRGGRVIRTFEISLMVPRAMTRAPAREPTREGDGQPAELTWGAIVRSPASLMSDRSSSSSGLGVVSSFSP